MRLIVVRHAKSSWDDPYLDDHDRPLSKRGRKSADAIGQWLADMGYVPKIALSSTSKRTHETWERIQNRLPAQCEVRFERDLYHGYSDSFFRKLALVDTSPALVLGHNPGIGMFAHSILTDVPAHSGFSRYPTAATLVCDFPVSRWADASNRQAKLIDFVVPRELT